MNNVKFDAWDTSRKKRFTAREMGVDELTLNPDGRGFVNVNGVSIRLSHYCKHMIPLMYTTLSDKNGREIIEGDIVKTALLKSNESYLVEIVFRDGNFVCVDKDNTVTYIFSGNSMRQSEVVGNIYENPELLKR